MSTWSDQPGEPGLVSVILPTYNREQTLARAIRSVLQQGYGNLEVVVVDDASTDNTAAVMATFTDPRVRYIRLEQNGGASRARNVGLKAARGEFIAFQDSDDEFLADKIQKQVDAARSVSGPVTVFHIKVIYGVDSDYNYGPHEISISPILPDNMSQDDFRRQILKKNYISPQTLLFSRSALEAAGPFDECLVNSVDWDIGIRLIHRTHVIFLGEPLVMTYTQDNSISRLRKRAARSQLRISLKMRRHYDIEPAVLGDHLGRLGMVLSKFGMPRRGRYLLRTAVKLDPTRPKHWMRLASTEALSLAYPLTRRLGWRVWRTELKAERRLA
jgi:glycosyltransferase involved in cell wall biosynthesis